MQHLNHPLLRTKKRRNDGLENGPFGDFHKLCGYQEGGGVKE